MLYNLNVPVFLEDAKMFGIAYDQMPVNLVLSESHINFRTMRVNKGTIKIQSNKLLTLAYFDPYQRQVLQFGELISWI